MSMIAFDIDRMVDELVPVRRVRPGAAMLLTGIATCGAIGLVVLLLGLRSDIVSGAPHPIVFVRGGMLLLLGIAALVAVMAAARPGIGQTSDGWRWSLAAAALFPITAAVIAMIEGRLPLAELTSQSAIWCIGISLLNALAIGGLLTAWVRQGAPTNLERTGWLVGIAAGSFGTFAYSLHCPSNTVAYAGIWYTLAVGLSAVVGRLAVPRAIRW